MIDEKELELLTSEVKLIDVYTEMFRKGDFSFIVDGLDENGKKVTHYKQKEALEILTSGNYEEFLYGGAAGGAKTYTACVWLLFMCLCYPETRWFVSRNELKDLLDSVLVTFNLVCRTYGFDEFKFNAVKNYIHFDNGSHINLIEIKYKPSDPMYEDLGSTEYTSGFMEEIGEAHRQAYIVLRTRIGRYKNKEYKLKKMLFMTCNPKNNWAKSDFYDKHLKGELESHKYYLQCLITENPFLTEDYVNSMRRLASEHKPTYERLFMGNWNYEDNPYQLAEQEMIDIIYDNDQVQDGKGFITADVARFGSDKARIGYWSGWNLKEVISLDISKTTDVELAIKTLRWKYKIPKNRVIIDADGVGGGVVDGSGGKGFNNGGRPIKKGKDMPNYRNLQVQCLYLLSEKINEGGLYISADLTNDEKEEIKTELAQIQSKGDQDSSRKLDCKTKAEIKQDIGRSPDWRDMILMRVYFDLKETKRQFMGSRKRNVL